MRTGRRVALLGALLMLAPGTGEAQVTSLASCEARITEDPAAARDEAADWRWNGGGAAATICEAYALVALGATRNAALKLTQLAENQNAGLTDPERADLLQEATVLWITDGRAALAEETIRASIAAGGVTPMRLVLRARTTRLLGDPGAALPDVEAALGAAPNLPAALYEHGAVLHALDRGEEGIESLFRVLDLAPDGPDAERATVLIQEIAQGG
ncbi:MAG: tetratricopeptide repeat protein [Pseudomonadota bacterium]